MPSKRFGPHPLILVMNGMDCKHGTRGAKLRYEQGAIPEKGAVSAEGKWYDIDFGRRDHLSLGPPRPLAPIATLALI